MSFSSSFDAEKISRIFMAPAVTAQKIHGREVFSFYRVASLTTYKYLRRIIALILISHCIKVYNVCNIYSIHGV